MNRDHDHTARDIYEDLQGSDDEVLPPTAALIAQCFDRLLQTELGSIFELDMARLYAIPKNQNQEIFLAMAENPYELMMTHSRPADTIGGCLVVTGWASPLESASDTPPNQEIRPSEHPQRQRVRVCVAICEDEIATVMRTSDQPDDAKQMSERGMGGIPDVLEAWWEGSL